MTHERTQKELFTPKYLLLDVDGVMTQTALLYNENGKSYKVFGPDDHGALSLLRDKLKIIFITADKRGFPISRRRIVDEMKFDLHLVSEAERIKWIQENVKPEETIFIGDSLFDIPVFKIVGYSICPANGFYKTREAADYVTTHNGGDRAVAEACLHILEHFYNITEVESPKAFGIWKDTKN